MSEKRRATEEELRNLWVVERLIEPTKASGSREVLLSSVSPDNEQDGYSARTDVLAASFWYESRDVPISHVFIIDGLFFKGHRNGDGFLIERP